MNETIKANLDHVVDAYMVDIAVGAFECVLERAEEDPTYRVPVSLVNMARMDAMALAGSSDPVLYIAEAPTEKKFPYLVDAPEEDCFINRDLLWLVLESDFEGAYYDAREDFAVDELDVLESEGE